MSKVGRDHEDTDEISEYNAEQIKLITSHGVAPNALAASGRSVFVPMSEIEKDILFDSALNGYGKRWQGLGVKS